MSFPNEDLLTEELKRLYLAAHPDAPETICLLVEEILPEEASYYVRVGSTTYEVTVPMEDLMSGPLDYIVGVMGLAEIVEPEAVI